MSLDIIFRADANARIGTGHIMRCIALAHACQKRGGHVTFLSHCQSETLQHQIIKTGFNFIFVKHSHPDPDDLNHVLDRLHRFPDGIDPPWFVLDGYHFDADYQNAIYEAGAKMVVIDDYQHLPYYHADIILNQNIGAEQLNYPCRDHTLQMLGSRYVLLRNDFLAWHNWERKISDMGKKILITLGGADPDNVAHKVITLLQRLDVDELEAIVVCGANNPHIETVQTACERSTFPIRMLRNAQNMSELMAWADICISGAGITSWELAYMGLPQVILILAENQRQVANNLARYHIALDLGWYSEINDDDFLVRLRDLIFSPERRSAMSKNGREIIDGEGADRVSSKMANLTPSHLSAGRLDIRRASLDDAVLLWEWANDPIVRSNSFNPHAIPIGNHMDWYKEKIASEDTVIYIIEMDKTPVAQIRYDCGEDECATISFSVASRYRGCGIGEQTLLLSAKKACRTLGVKKLKGAVLDYNEASKRIFIKAGFRRIGLEEKSDKMSHIFLWECPE